jgi:ankyrin repeat protein
VTQVISTLSQADKNSSNDRAFRDLKFHSDGTIRTPGKNLLPATATDRIGNGLMHYAVMHNRTDVITQLSKRNVPLNQKNHLELTPFALACIMADAKLLHFIARRVEPADLYFKMPPREALTLAPIKYRSSAQERLKQAFEYF